MVTIASSQDGYADGLPAMKRLNGWILDAYPVLNGMCVWIIDEEGHASSHLDPWQPYFYLQAPEALQAHIRVILESFRVPLELRVVERKEFFSGHHRPVIEVRVGNPLMYRRMTDRLAQVPDVTLFNADLNLVQAYFYERGLFPLAKCSFEVSPTEGRIAAWELQDSPWTLVYDLPPLRYASLGIDSLLDARRKSLKLPPHHQRQGIFLFSLGPELGQGTTYVLDGSERDMLRSLQRHMDAWDPDVVLTDWGDSFIMPRLQLLSDRCGLPLHLSRDSEKYMGRAAARSFFSYGRIHHRAGDRTLYGRLHIDVENSFVAGHSGLDGLFEVARVAKIPLQRAARCTIGTSLSSVQHDWAIRQGFLIPLDKGQTEDFRPAEDLIAADRGGLVYEPDVGWHEDLIEFDFASMYPEIMIRHNVTPEKINCACCRDNQVPELRHHICRREKGMMPQILEPIVRKRQTYKEMIQAGHPLKDTLKRRREAFKWMLVTCFGYLGFRNARFGRIEAHECVGAYSRDILLKAKETAEEAGFHFLHAIVDSMWLKKPGASETEVEHLRQKIEEVTGIPLALEGRYRWIHFCPSKINPRVGVPNRYVGAFRTGELKVRGIELRRHDTPPLIKAIQQQMLDILATATNVEELFRVQDRVAAVVAAFRDRLKTGQVSPVELAVSFQLSRDPDDYRKATHSAIAAKKLKASGIDVQPGETIQYIVTNEHDPVRDWRVIPLAFIEDSFDYDHAYYERLLERAVEITPFNFKNGPRQTKAKTEARVAQLMLFDFL